MIFEIKISTIPDLEVFDEPPNKKHKRNETVNIFDFADNLNQLFVNWNSIYLNNYVQNI
jgi:hypothetical protein